MVQSGAKLGAFAALRARRSVICVCAAAVVEQPLRPPSLPVYVSMRVTYIAALVVSAHIS